MGGAHLGAARLAADLQNGLGLRVEAGPEAVHVDQQDRLLSLGKAHAERTALDGDNGAAVHDLQGAGQNARGDDAGNGVGGLADRVEQRHHGLEGLGLALQADRHLGNNPHGPFGAYQQAHQVVARRVEGFSAQAHDLAIPGHQRQAKHVVGGDTVLETVRAAGVFRHVPADGADRLAGGVRREVEALVLNQLGQLQVGVPRLHHGPMVAQVELE